MNEVYMNIEDTVSKKPDTLQKIRNEVSQILSEKALAGQLDLTKEQNLFVSTTRGAVNVMLIPSGKWN